MAARLSRLLPSGVTLMLLGATATVKQVVGQRQMVAKTLPQAVADEFGSKCLNGAPPTYEIRRNASSNKWVLFLEGGGWCYGATASATIASCAHRGGFSPPSMGSFEERVTVTDYGGILGADPSVNPDFFTWNAVFIHYCDGASMGSSRLEPLQVKSRSGSPAQLWMRGRNNFNAVIDYLQHSEGMASATDVILSGGSAGGLAVFYNLDHLVTLLPKGVRVTGFPDAGFFMDAPGFVANFKGADPVWNVTGSTGTNQNCLAAYSKEEQWKCLLAPFILEHIETPIYVMNSAYDAWQIGNNHVGCVSTPSEPCNDSDVQAYGAKLKARVTSALALKKGGVGGAYIDSCYVHEQNVNYCSGQGMPNCVGWSPSESGSKKWGYTTNVTAPSGDVLSPQQAFSKFYFTAGKTDSVLVDQKQLGQNPSCIYLGHPAV